MEIYLIRHTTPVLEPGLIYGRKELLLHEDFPNELKQIKEKLPDRFDAVYTSPALRCTELTKEIDPDFIIDPRLQELDFGDWEGKTWDTVDQAALHLWMDDYVNVCVPAGESMLQMHERVAAFWNELIASDYQKVAVITHAGVIRLILAMVRGIALEDIFNIKVAYGEVVRIEGLLPGQ